MTGIELVIGTIAPGDSIESLAVQYLVLDTPVRVSLQRLGGDMYGRIVGVLLDTGKRGPVRNGEYRPSGYDIAPNVVSYIVREDGTERDFECLPAKVSAHSPVWRWHSLEFRR